RGPSRCTSSPRRASRAPITSAASRPRRRRRSGMCWRAVGPLRLDRRAARADPSAHLAMARSTSSAFALALAVYLSATSGLARLSLPDLAWVPGIYDDAYGEDTVRAPGGPHQVATFQRPALPVPLGAAFVDRGRRAASGVASDFPPPRAGQLRSPPLR